MFDSTTVTTSFRKGKPIEIPYCKELKRESNHLELNSLREEYAKQQDALEAEGKILIGEGITASWG